MPKVIEGLDRKILTCSRQLLMQQGAQALTIRAVAKQCGVAVGTVYHYYDDKAQLMAHVMLEDWKEILKKTTKSLEEVQSLPEGFYTIWQGLNTFVETYREIWAEARQAQDKTYHEKLIEQISGLVVQVLRRFAQEEEEQVPAFLAENLLRLAQKDELTYKREEFLLLRVLKS